jgi:tetratricopeptide (TPR) repeat protein
MPEAQVNGLVLAAEVKDVAQLMALEHYAAAFEAARRHVSVSPGNWLARLQLGTLFLLAREYDAAARELGILRNGPELVAGSGLGRLAPLVANNFAWACFMLDETARLDDADRASAEAHQKLPNAASILGTRGAVLVALGRVEEGKPLLKRALKLHRTRVPKATNLVSLALAALQQGQRKSARKLLKEAREMDPDCELLARGERELQARRRSKRKAPVAASGALPQ